MNYRVEFEESAPAVEFESAKDCLDFTKELHDRGSPANLVGAFFYNHLEESMLIVLGGEHSYLSFCPSNYVDTGLGSFSSNATLNLDVDEDYWCCGHHGQIPKENVVSIHESIEALEYFLDQGGRSRRIEWLAD